MSDTHQTGGGTAGPAAPPPVLPPDPDRPAYDAPVQQRFVDRVLDMRAVIAVALAALIIGGLSGFILGEHTGGGDRFGPGRGGFPGGQGFPGGPGGGPGRQGQQPFGQGQSMR